MNQVRTRSHSGSRRTLTPKASRDSLGTTATLATSTVTNSKNLPHDAVTIENPQPQLQPQSHRLFGTYMNSLATYQDTSTAWLSSDSMLSWVTSSVYERFAGGGYMSGVKLVRGYSEPSKSKEKDKGEKGTSTMTEAIPGLDERQQKILKRRSAPPTSSTNDLQSQAEPATGSDVETREVKLQRQISSLIESEGRNKAEAEEEIRRREEQEIQDDYNAQAGETQGREIEHLVLVTHGIGQLLSLRYVLWVAYGRCADE